MRNICALLALSLAVGCGGGDGKDGSDGTPGPQGAAGPPGANGADGDNGENGAPGTDGTNGTNGADGAPGTDGTNGTNGADGGAILQGSGAPAAGLGADGDIYIDTVSRDVYQKANGTWTVITNLSGGPAGPKGDQGDPGVDGLDGAPGTNGTNGADGADGSSVRTGAGAPAAGLGNVGDVYINSTNGDLYSKGAGGWTVVGNLTGPAGNDGADGTDGVDGQDGVDVKDTLEGVPWFALALNAAFANTPSLITSETYTDVSSTAAFTFTGANQHGRLGFHTNGGFVPGGVDMYAFSALNVTAAVTGGAVAGVRMFLVDGDNVGCQWDTTTAAGPAYSFDLTDPTSCYDNSGAQLGFSLASVTGIQFGIISSGAGARTLTITDISLVSN